jgi:hypothetical protein
VDSNQRLLLEVMGRLSVLNLEDCYGYRFIYGGVSEYLARNKQLLLESMVGAARFELATPCAKPIAGKGPKRLIFKYLQPRAVVETTLESVEPG